MVNFRRFFIIQCRSDGRFLTEDLGYSYLAENAGRLYDADEAIDTAILHLDDDFKIFSAWEKVNADS